ncbi:MAG: hypothetical protein ACR2GY_05545 [Phycisphaerales bacterium]
MHNLPPYSNLTPRQQVDFAKANLRAEAPSKHVAPDSLSDHLINFGKRNPVAVTAAGVIAMTLLRKSAILKALAGVMAGKAAASVLKSLMR